MRLPLYHILDKLHSSEEVPKFESTLLMNGSRSRKDFTSNMASLVGSPKDMAQFYTLAVNSKTWLYTSWAPVGPKWFHIVFDNESLTMIEFLTMSLWECNVSFCRQAAAGRKWVDITNSVTGAHEPVRTHSRSLQTATCTHTLLVLQTYFDPYVHFDVYVRSYLGLLAPAFVVALVLQATNAQVGRTTGGSPYFPVIIGKSTHFLLLPQVL